MNLAEFERSDLYADYYKAFGNGDKVLLTAVVIDLQKTMELAEKHSTLDTSPFLAGHFLADLSREAYFRRAIIKDIIVPHVAHSYSRAEALALIALVEKMDTAGPGIQVCPGLTLSIYEFITAWESANPAEAELLPEVSEKSGCPDLE